MPEARAEQRNVYRGEPARAWVHAELVAREGRRHALDLVVDTGNPCEVIIDIATMLAMEWREATDSDSNFGLVRGGWLRLAIPEIGFDARFVGFANDKVVEIVKRSDRRFGGLIGLPLLRMLEYGGDQGCFWVRTSDLPRTA